MRDISDRGRALECHSSSHLLQSLGSCRAVCLASTSHAEHLPAAADIADGVVPVVFVASGPFYYYVQTLQ